MVATHSVVALGLGMLTGSAVAWHNPWDVRPKAYHTTNQCEVPRGASAKTKFYSYDLNPEWGTLDFLGPAAKVWNQKGGSRGGSDWNRFCGDMYSSYASGEGHGGKGSICGKPWKLWWAQNASATRAAFWASDFQRNPEDRQYYQNWDKASYWMKQGLNKNNGKLRLKSNSLNCKHISGYDKQSRFLGPMAEENQLDWSQPPGFRYEDQTDLIMTLVSCVQPCFENTTSKCCLVPTAVAPLFPCCAAGGCCKAGGAQALRGGHRKLFARPTMAATPPTVANNVKGGAASRATFNNLLASLRAGKSLQAIMDEA